ncbi:zinc finger SWIM domain-containing protein 7-like isoform X2 [Argiope bruennichi]|uniref:zinc finger SWIM domain-containing protein 7-like isoform X2 n=1 Tax=Argiope bruennichi TaxID=94029 RepID=UPI002494EF63|nr:zinc finger SWIM domain-containing protein 7-like isoform X2 [Argiope bruennichi]
MSDGTLSMLSFLFDFTAVQALDLIDHRCVSHITSPSGRELYKVQKNTTEFHICLKNSNYCTCPSFVFHVLKKDQLMCKHKLAVMLSIAMNLCKEVQYADETVTLMLMGENS